LNNTISFGLKHEPQKFKSELIDISRSLLRQRTDFIPTSFNQSIQYDASVIACFTKFVAFYFATVSEIENYYAREQIPEDAELLRVREERSDFLAYVRVRTVETISWALDKRQVRTVYIHKPFNIVALLHRRGMHACMHLGRSGEQAIPVNQFYEIQKIALSDLACRLMLHHGRLNKGNRPFLRTFSF
jgi:hypothetical protein